MHQVETVCDGIFAICAVTTAANTWRNNGTIVILAQFSRSHFCGYYVATTSLNLLKRPAIKLSQEKKLLVPTEKCL